MTSIPTLALNGEAIQLKNMRVTVSQQFQDKDQSGQTSATTKSEQGAKGKNCGSAVKYLLNSLKY